MKPVVFGGPSLFGLPPELLIAFDLRGPARAGDLLRAASDGARNIALIDGLFDQTASVWHKEILWALARGVTVAGAASMGALRACECEAFGMIGVGRVFEDYRAGRRVADADVALLHAPGELGYRPLTVALVDVSATLERLSGDGLVENAEAAQIGDCAAALHFSRRSWRSILAGTEIKADRKSALSALIAGKAVSQKMADARHLLELMNEGRLPRASAVRPWRLAETPFLDRLRASVGA
ncbi:TfuA-like protein [Mesorhizobium sp. 1B3]|uniref:TfuA-like protein n=1 Tax=Mesorhizobium sp. 1B3 TaxID=3243599 RepID=UPI003D971F9C